MAKPLKLNGAWVCVNCHARLQTSTFRGKRVRPQLRCGDCFGLHNLWKQWLCGRRHAGRLVAMAIKLGQLQRPATYACVDCGNPAHCYDHRDYGKPLDVVPVCRSCNSLRGPGKPLNPFLVAGLLLAAHA